MFPSIKQHNSLKDEDITQLILDVIILDIQPMSIVTDQGFKRLIRTAWPKYSMPTRQTFANRLNSKYDKHFSELKKELNKTKHVAITEDGYTSKFTQDKYDTVTVHFVKDHRLVSRCLELFRFDGHAHDSEHIKDNLLSCFDSWGIRSKVVALTTDNAATEKCACNKLISELFDEGQSVNWIPCSAHTIQLAVKVLDRNP